MHARPIFTIPSREQSGGLRVHTERPCSDDEDSIVEGDKNDVIDPHYSPRDYCCYSKSFDSDPFRLMVADIRGRMMTPAHNRTPVYDTNRETVLAFSTNPLPEAGLHLGIHEI